MHTLKCDAPGCNREFSYETEAKAKRVLGYHKARAHGIPGATNLKAQARLRYRCKYCGAGFEAVNELGSHTRFAHKDQIEKNRLAKEAKLSGKKMFTPEQMESRREYQQRYRAAHKTISVPLSSGEQSHRRALQKSAWWKVESEKSEARTVWCPCCGANFSINKRSE